ncbi:hypothetical protein PTKIN_Ptkin08bG0090400 [Pterospermum kingtungense]
MLFPLRFSSSNKPNLQSHHRSVRSNPPLNSNSLPLPPSIPYPSPTPAFRLCAEFSTFQLGVFTTQLPCFCDRRCSTLCQTERVLLVRLSIFDHPLSVKRSVMGLQQKDLGLDCLDNVEIVMALEEEFKLKIPDKEVDKIDSCNLAIEYICNHPMAG